jgi:dUTP pyrophosphatase
MYKNKDFVKRLTEAVSLGKTTEFLKEYEAEANVAFESSAFKIPLKFENKSNNSDPEFAKIGDSGFDIRADLGEMDLGGDELIPGSITLGPLERILISTGLFFELPEGFELQIRPRSGLAAKHGITVLNTPGTVDDQYRGEIKIILVNLSNEPFTVKHGDRIAQGVLANVSGQRIVNLVKVDEINKNTDRAEGGFGSTGIQ